MSQEVVYFANGAPIGTPGQISGFSFDPNTGSIGKSITSVTGPDAPCGVKADPAASFLYACTGNSAQIYAYVINRTTGELTQINGSPFSAPIFVNTSDLTIDPTGRYLFVTDIDTGAFAIDGPSGALTFTGFTIQDPFGPVQFAVDPGGKFLYAANSIDASGSEFSAFSISAQGKLSPIPGSPFSFQRASNPFGIVIHNSGKFLYSTLSSAHSIAEMHIDSTGALTSIPGSPIGAGLFPESLALDPSGRFLYVGNIGDATISAYNVDSTTGVLTPIGTFNINEGFPSVVVVDPSGNFVFTTVGGSDLVLFSIDQTTGALTRLKGFLPIPSDRFAIITLQ